MSAIAATAAVSARRMRGPSEWRVTKKGSAWRLATLLVGKKHLTFRARISSRACVPQMAQRDGQRGLFVAAPPASSQKESGAGPVPNRIYQADRTSPNVTHSVGSAREDPALFGCRFQRIGFQPLASDLGELRGCDGGSGPGLQARRPPSRPPSGRDSRAGPALIGANYRHKDEGSGAGGWGTRLLDEGRE